MGIEAWAIGQECALSFDALEKPVQVRADAVADALRNLVKNAVAHAPPDTEVAVTVYPDGGMSVADRGAGVAPEDWARVFERFWRGRGERQSGGGLGLAIVAEIARAHGPGRGGPPPGPPPPHGPHTNRRASGAAEFHRRALSEPDVSLSAHPAPSIRPCRM